MSKKVANQNAAVAEPATQDTRREYDIEHAVEPGALPSSTTVLLTGEPASEPYLPDTLLAASTSPKLGLLSALGFSAASVETLTAPKAKAKANGPTASQGGRGRLQKDGSRPKGTFIDVLKKQALDAARANGHEFGLYKNECVFFHAVNACRLCGATLDVQPGVDGPEGDAVTGTALTATCDEEARKAFEASKPAPAPKPEKPAREPKAPKPGKAPKDDRQLSPTARLANKRAKADPTLANAAPGTTVAHVPAEPVPSDPKPRRRALSDMTDDELRARYVDLSDLADGSDLGGAARLAQTQLAGLREYAAKRGLDLDAEITEDMLSEEESEPSEACNGMKPEDVVSFNGQAATVLRIHESGDKVVLKLKGMPGEYEVACDNPTLRVRRTKVSA